MGKILDAQIAYLHSVSKEEFEIMVKFGLAAKEFQIHNLRKSSQVSNDLVFDLYRIEKNGLIPKEEKFRYIVYVDRNPNEYDTSWAINFVQNNGINFNDVVKIFVVNLNKIPKVTLDGDWNHEKKFKFLFHKKCFNFLFRLVKKDSMQLLESLYPNEHSVWDNKTAEEQKNFCNSLGITFVKYSPLWKYPLADQAKLIFNISTRNKKNQNHHNDSYKYEKQIMDYYELLAVGKNATYDDIQKSYRKLTLLYHPDKSKTSGTMMMHIREAYEVLSDLNKRKKYDKMMSSC